jgi:hypothetical protein
MTFCTCIPSQPQPVVQGRFEYLVGCVLSYSRQSEERRLKASLRLVFWISTAWIWRWNMQMPGDRRPPPMAKTSQKPLHDLWQAMRKYIQDNLVRYFSLHSSTAYLHRLSSSRHAFPPTSLSARSSRPAGGFSHFSAHVHAELARIFMPAPIVNLDSRTRAIRRAASGRGRGRSMRRG